LHFFKEEAEELVSILLGCYPFLLLLTKPFFSIFSVARSVRNLLDGLKDEDEEETIGLLFF